MGDRGGLPLLLRLPQERQRAAEFQRWDQVREMAAGSPVVAVDQSTARRSTPAAAARPAGPGQRGPGPPLQPGRADRAGHAADRGVLHRLRLLAVSEETVLPWTTADSIDTIARIHVLDTDVVVTWTPLRVIGFLCAFSALYFTVTAVTDANYQEDSSTTSSRRSAALAVRTVYVVALVGSGSAPAQDGASQRPHQPAGDARSPCGHRSPRPSVRPRGLGLGAASKPTLVTHRVTSSPRPLPWAASRLCPPTRPAMP